jgi:hypothetical protein
MPQKGMQREREERPAKSANYRPPPPTDIAPVSVPIQSVVNRDAAEIVTAISVPIPQRFFDERFQGVREVTSRVPNPQPATIKPESSVSAAGALFAFAAVLTLVSGLAWWLAGGRRKPGTTAADRYGGRPSRVAHIPDRCSRVLAPWAWGG